MLRILLLSLVMLLAGCSEQAAHFNSTDVTGADWGRDIHLNDATGKPRQLADFKGKAVVLFFGYTQCPDICPTTMSKLREVMKALGDDANRVQVLFVTLDPERDTPALLTQYVPSFDARFLGLYASVDTTKATAKDFRIFFEKVAGTKPGSYTIDHTAGLYTFDPQGRLRLFVRDGDTAANITADLKTLLAGK
jgi:protein SCO1